MEYEELKLLLKKQRSEMTTTERIKAYNAGQEVDCIPHTLQTPDEALAHIYGFTTSQLSRDIEVKSEVIRRKTEEFGLDNFNIGLGLKGIGAALGSKVVAPEHGIDYVAEYVLTDYADFDKLEVVDPYKSPVLAPILETAKQIRERFPNITITTSVSGPITTAVSVRPIEKLLRDTVKNPEMLHKLLDLTVECALKWIEAFHNELGVVETSFSDPVTCMDILSKKQFDKFSMPYIRKLMEGIEKIMGARPGTHICGKTKAIWNDLADAGLTYFSVDNCEDIEEMKNLVGDRMRIAGNVPPVNVMQLGTIDEVIEACRVCIEKGADNPMGFILNTGCEPPIGTPRENIEAFIYAARKYGRGARLGQVPEGLKNAG